MKIFDFLCVIYLLKYLKKNICSPGGGGGAVSAPRGIGEEGEGDRRGNCRGEEGGGGMEWKGQGREGRGCKGDRRREGRGKENRGGGG